MRRTLSLLATLPVVLAAACGSENEDLQLGGSCTLNSDCKDPLVCKLGACHQACMQSRDCPTGERCVQVDNIGVCQQGSELSCVFGGAVTCKTPLLCAPDNVCRKSCTSGGDCMKEQECVAGVCLEAAEAAAGRADGGAGIDSGNGKDSGGLLWPADADTPTADASTAAEVVADAAQPATDTDIKTDVAYAPNAADANPDVFLQVDLPDGPVDVATDTTGGPVDLATDTTGGPVDLAMDIARGTVDASPDEIAATFDSAVLPTIISFVAGANPVNAGHATTLTATFLNGSGAVTPGIGPVTSGIPVSTGILNESTTFTLTVTGSKGQTADTKLTITVLFPPQAIASGSGTVAALATDGSNLYFGQGTSLMKVSNSGGTPVPLASVASSGASAIATDGANVYWTEKYAGVVGKVSVAGAGQYTLATDQYYANAIVVAGDSVYWTTEGTLASVPDAGPGGYVTLPAAPENTGKVMKAAIAGGAQPVVLASQQGKPSTLAVRQSNVYWAGTSTDLRGTISTVSIAGGEMPRNLAIGLAYGSNIAVNDRGIYWLDLMQPSGIVRLPFSGGATSQVVASNLPPFVATLVLDVDNVYWTGFGSGVVVNKASLDGTGTLVTLASTTSSTGPAQGSPLVVDATSVYYVVNSMEGGNPGTTYTLYKVAK